MVLHEEHHQPKCSSRPPSSKKNRAKKIPQRGLGVAQLEKLRIEEQQKIGSSNQPPPSASPQPIPFVGSAIDSDPPESQTMDLLNGTSAGEIKYLSSLWGDEISNLSAVNSRASFMPVSSGVSLQTEPPSNQNHSTNSSSRREAERIVGRNLPWPFHPDAAVSFPCKVPQFGNPFQSMPMIFSRGGASGSSLSRVEWRSSEMRVNKRLKEDSGFLTLGSSATQPVSKLKQPMAAAPQEFSLLRSQGGMENAAKQDAGSTEKTFYSFLPMRPAACEADGSKRSDEAVDGVDTSLKL